MKRGSQILVLAVLGGGLCYGSRGCDGPARAPDERLTSDLAAMCDIAADGVRHPAQGVDRLFGYLGEHSPRMLHDLGELLVLIERIADDDGHDARAALAGRRLQGQIGRCAATWERFADAIEADPEARAHLDRGVQRVGRSLELIFGPGDDARSLRDLPPALLRRIDTRSSRQVE